MDFLEVFILTIDQGNWKEKFWTKDEESVEIGSLDFNLGYQLVNGPMEWVFVVKEIN